MKLVTVVVSVLFVGTVFSLKVIPQPTQGPISPKVAAVFLFRGPISPITVIPVVVEKK